MSQRQGLTLMEILVVLIIVGIVAAFLLPNFTTPTEQARAVNVQNNLLAVYGAQQNYRNNSGNFASAASLALINSTLALNIQDDGTYTYSCAPPVCTAIRSVNLSQSVGGVVSTQAFKITVTLNQPVQLTGEINPACSPAGSNICP